MNGDFSGGAVDPRIALAAMLISLGLATVEKIRELFSSEEEDDETLAAIMVAVESRIARRRNRDTGVGPV